MNQASVYIVVINWNGIDDTLDCLSSLARLTIVNAKTLVIDNGSEGDQADTIEKAFPDTVVLRQSENLGFCGGCNVGIRYAMDQGADHVLLLNNDTIVEPDFLEKLLNAARKYEDTGAVSPVVSCYPATSEISYYRPVWNSKQAVFTSENDGYPNKTEPFSVDIANGCCMLVPAAVFKIGGLLDERYFAYYDEIDWCYRIKRLGYKCYVVPGAMIHHKTTASTPAPIRDYLRSRNRLLWMKENLSLRERLRSARFLLKDYLWHLLNSQGFTEPRISRECSTAIVLGARDYFLGRFYKWDERTERRIYRGMNGRK